FLEPKRRYWVREEVQLPVNGLPLGRARVVREGTDATIIAYGPMLRVALDAAEEAAADGVACEVIDVRTLVPLDLDTLIASVRKTGRAVVVHEAPVTGGVGAELAARITEEDFTSLEAPIIRVGGFDTPY